MTRVDLRSDILVRPTPAMLDAMVVASRLPRGYGMREDRDQRELEALAGELLGTEDALFFSTCTMANQTALMVHCRPGELVITDKDAHVGGLEASATYGVAGAVLRAVAGRAGHPRAADVGAMLAAPARDTARRIALVWLENTHNHAGGTVMTPDELRAVAAVCAHHGVPIHVDGARIWNAAVALGVAPVALTEGVASIAVSLNKALGAPLGALLAGSRCFVAEALRVRQMLGGGWRPTGILAAAGVVALRTRRERLTEDHARARRLAERLAAEHNWLSFDLASVQSNIVVAVPDADIVTPQALVDQLNELGVLALTHGTRGIRMVTHAEIDDASVEATLRAFANIARSVDSPSRRRARRG